MNFKKIEMLAFAMILCLIFPTASTFASQTNLSSTQIGLTPSGIPVENMESLIDELVTTYLNQTAPGAAVIVVNDGEIIFSKGYGYANIEEQIPVDPSTTIFEYGSASKMFVWVSVMQLVEQGRLDLDEEIQTYLPNDFYSQLNFDKPFTIRDLMNHSAGFGEYPFNAMIDLSVVATAGTLREWLLNSQPLQIYEPGTASVYSNFGTALAAYIVGYVSGMEYAEIERQNILIPTGMTNTMNRPHWFGNEGFFENKANGYMPDGRGGFIRGMWSDVPMYPAGGMNGTAEDLARFAIALSSQHNAENPLFTDQNTFSLMFSPSTLDQTNAFGTMHGFLWHDGHVPTFWHGGNTASFTTKLVVAPSEDFGFVVLTNAGGEMDIVFGLKELLFGRNPGIATVNGNFPDASMFEGQFVLMNRPDGTLMEFISYLMMFNVTALDENSIRMSFGQFSADYEQIEPYVFRLVSSEGRFMDIAFNEIRFRMENGEPVQILTWNGQDLSALPSGRSMPVLVGSVVILVISIVFFLIMPIVLLIKFLRNKERALSRFGVVSTVFLLCGTSMVLNNLIALVRIMSNNVFVASSAIIPHIWVSYVILVLAGLMLISSVLIIVKEKIAIWSKPLYIVTFTLMLVFTLTLFNWSFFAML